VPDVDPIITAAWITGGVAAVGIAGTVMSSIVGSRNTREAAEQTVEAARAATLATLAAAREGQRWEREHAAYVETIADVLRRQRQRRYLVTNSLSEDSEQLRDFLGAHDPPTWLEAQARLIACASEWVKDAAEASRQAHLEVWARVHRYRLMGDDNRLALEPGRPGDTPFDGRELVAARKEIDAAIADADAMDNLLVTLIREEQRSNGRAVLTGQ
jgi:type II secretory pathway pseudopilin PulG